MILHLNPRFPLVWRTPTSLQFGVDSPVVRLDDVTSSQERIIAALSKGVSRPGLSLVAERAHGTEAELVELLERLQPALAEPTQPRHREQKTVSVIGITPTAARLRTTLRSCGIAIVPPESPADLGILVSHYVVEPELFGFWLSRDIPHLPIVFGDTGVQLGPFIEPGRGPCLYCLQRHRTDADPAWPAMATQLWGRLSPIEDGLTCTEVVAIAVRLIAQRLSGSPTADAASVFLTSATGETSRRQWKRHPECGCEALPENDSAHARPTDPGLTRTRKTATIAVPA